MAALADETATATRAERNWVVESILENVEGLSTVDCQLSKEILRSTALYQEYPTITVCAQCGAYPHIV